MKPQVGFMGLGIMGQAMAANILKAGYPLTVFNRTATRAAALARQGAAVAPTPKALAQAAEVSIAMVTGPEALYNLLWGPEGAAEALEPGKVLINMSSVSPSFTKEMAVQVAASGAVFIDAPVSGTKKPAEEGALVILAGGKEEKIRKLEPLLLTMGKKVIYCGRVGQGSMMKMFINLLLGVMMEGFAEALNFGRLGGLDFDAMLETVASGAMNSPMFQVKAANLKARHYPPAFPLKHLAKDCKFVVDTAFELGAPVPVGQTLLHLYRSGWAQGWGDEDISAIARVLEDLSSPEK
jgi:3-hydroxyisobutyrate dehydrogenase-like beta-hydroxyacid dehydrogenase